MEIIRKVRKFVFDQKSRNEFLELRRIGKIDRYKKDVSNVLNSPTYFVDSASFIFTYKEIFKTEIYKFKTHNKSPYIIDGGANIGLATIYFKQLFPNSEIIAFEPDDEVYETLSRNIESHNLKNVTLIKKGIWSEETVLSFVSEGADGGHIASNDSLQNKIIKIPTVNLNSYLNREVDFLKLDIEGAEEEVIISSTKSLKNVKRIFIEYHSFVGKEQRLNEILNILSENNFRIHINSPGLNSMSPFYKIKTENNMDFQINIFAFKS